MLSAQLLHEFPETRSVWNVRKRVLVAQFECIRARCQRAACVLERGPEPGAGAEEKLLSPNWLTELIEAELTLTAECARANPKSYATWAHRVWTFEHLAHALLELLTHSGQNADASLHRRVENLWLKELALTQHYLKLDARNCMLKWILLSFSTPTTSRRLCASQAIMSS